MNTTIGTKKHFAMLWVVWLTAACTQNHTTNELWSNYDYRYNPAAGAGYDYGDSYNDNDDNYTAPTGYGCAFDAGQVCE